MRTITLPKLGLRAAIARALLVWLPRSARCFKARRWLYRQGWQDVYVSKLVGMARGE